MCSWLLYAHTFIIRKIGKYDIDCWPVALKGIVQHHLYAGAYPSCHRVRARDMSHLWPFYNQSPINLTSLIACLWNVEYTELIHTERNQPIGGLDPRPYCRKAKVLAITPPCWNVPLIFISPISNILPFLESRQILAWQIYEFIYKYPWYSA